MKNRTTNQVMDELARELTGQEIDLSSGLMAQIRKEEHKKMKRRNFVIAAIAVMLGLTVLFSIPNVAQAVKRLFGYIPGTGLVEENSKIRVLKEPVFVQTDQGKITVEQVAADTSRTILTYQLDNIRDSGASSLKFEDYCHELPWLRLADGTYLNPKMIGGNSWASGFSRQLEFAALPASENTFVMGVNCIEGTPILENTQKIEMQFELIPAPSDLTVFPVVELASPTPETDGNKQSGDLSADLPVSLQLKKYVQTDSELILFGAMQTDAADFRLSLVEGSAVHLFDKNGVEIPMVEDSGLPDPDIQSMTGQVLPLTFRINGPYTSGDARLVVNDIWISQGSTLSFSFDLGADPQPGQKQELNRRLEDRGHSILIKDVTVTPDGKGLSFNYEASEGIANLVLQDANHDLLGGGGGDQNTSFTYRDTLPSGKINIVIAGYDEKISGPWQAVLDLPGQSAESQSTPIPEACLTASSWKAALANPPALPQTLQGELILMNLLPPMNTYHVMSAGLDGADALDLADGSNASLSPDGKTLVYMNDKGLDLMSLETNESIHVPETSNRDRWPTWSTDGAFIAFTRAPVSGLSGGGPGPYQLMLMNADGSEIRTLLANSEANYAQSWLPNEPTLIFTVMNRDGATVKSINVKTGEITFLREVNYQNTGVAVSPHGKRIAYEAMLPGDRYSIYTSNLDGSDEKLIANGDPMVVTVPFWSPDGQWLAVSVHDLTLNENSATLALVNPVTCQVIPLKTLNGYVTSWR